LSMLFPKLAIRMTRDRQIITLEQLPEIVSNFRSEEPKNFIRKRLKTYYPTHLLGCLEC